MTIQLRPHQVEAVEKLHNGCILYGGVGSGKTITSLAYYYTKACGGTLNKIGSMTKPKDLYVITTAKVRDDKAFDITAARMAINADRDISTNGVKITVDSWNNLHKYVEVKDAFFIFDEQRVVGYGAWARAFIKIARVNEWILLSATPGDTWLDYIPVFIANGWYKHKTDFLDQHVIWTPRVKYPKVLRYQNVGKLVKLRNDILVHMPMERHTTRHSVYVNCEYDLALHDKVVKRKWHVYDERPLRDVSELFSVMRKVVNSDDTRRDAIRSLISRHPKLIVFYNFDYELEILREIAQEISDASNGPSSSSSGQRSSQSGKKHGETPTESSGQWLLSDEGMVANDLKTAGSIATGLTSVPADSDRSESSSPSSRKTSASTSEPTEVAGELSGEFAVAEWNGHKHESIPATERWLYLVQYTAGAEGWNCIETDAIAFWSQTYSYRAWWQAHGRIDRLNTPFKDLYYYNFISKAPIDKAIRAALRSKKNFNERDLKVA